MTRSWIRVVRGAAASGIFCASVALFPQLLRADDCKSDLRRAEDCLRSDGFAQGLGTAVATTVTVLVNGAAISSLVFKGDDGGDGGDDTEEKKREYQLELKTEEQRTDLDTDGIDSLYVYARVTCSDPKVDSVSITKSLGFAKGGENESWLTVDPEGLSEGFQSALVSAFPPTDDAELTEAATATITVATTLDGHPVNGVITLTLNDDLWDLEIFSDDPGLQIS